MQNYQMMAMISPELALTSYEVEKLPAWVTEMTGAPSSLLRNDAERENLQQLVAQLVVQSQQNAQPA